MGAWSCVWSVIFAQTHVVKKTNIVMKLGLKKWESNCNKLFEEGVSDDDSVTRIWKRHKVRGLESVGNVLEEEEMEESRTVALV